MDELKTLRDISDKMLQEWADEIDPDGTFLNECESAVKWRATL